MSLGIDSLHKILKDETRRKAILLLNDKPLTYTELIDALDIISTGTLNYHLKVLSNLVTKNDMSNIPLQSREGLLIEY